MDNNYLSKEIQRGLNKDKMTQGVSKYFGLRVLILEGYTRQSLPFLKALKELGCETYLLCNSKWDCGYWSRYADHKILGVCDREKPVETESYIVELVKSGKYDVVIPPFDFSAEIMSHNKAELQEYAKIAVSDAEPFDIAHDKMAVMRTCKENGIPHPQTLFGVHSLDDVKNSGIPFPVFIKPRDGAGAKGCHTFQTFDELAAGVAKYNIDITKYIIQECIPIDSRLVSETLFLDNKGEVKSAYQYESVRFFPLSGGTGTMNETIDRKDIHETCIKLAKIIGLRGSVAVDLMIDSRDDVGKVLEINPRILACSTIGFFSGVNQAKQILEKESGEEVSEQMEYKVGQRVRMLQTDILWFLKSPNRFKCKPSWFSWKNTKEQTFSWSDPLPWFVFLFNGLKELGSELKKRN